MKIIKRNGSEAIFDKEKIYNAIIKAMKYGSGLVNDSVARLITNEIETEILEESIRTNKDTTTIELVENMVYYKLTKYDQLETAKAYEGYRAIQSFKRENNTTDDSILSLLDFNNTELMNENSNKNALLISTQRDLIAGEVSKDIYTRKKLPSNIAQAHDLGILHKHDRDYLLQPSFNCCLINIQDMLDNGTVINKRKIDSPNSFQVACTVMTQIIAQVASNQFGGQSVNIAHLGKYLRRSKEKYIKMLEDNPNKDNLVNILLKNELAAGVQTIQYQINTLMTTNGQSPFVTLFLNIDEEDEYVNEVSMIVEEILTQRIKGIKNEKGIYTTPAFPKLIYVLHDHNCLDGGKFDYITKIAVECTSRRLYPDYISSKEMKKNYEGNVFSAMGCRSFLSPWKDENGNYKFDGRFNQSVVSINLPQMGIIANGDFDKLWELFDNRTELCYDSLIHRYNELKGTLSDVSPIHWQHGAIARLKPGETIDKLLEGGYSTLSLGYIGLYELTKLMTGKSHTTPEGKEFAVLVMKKLNDKVNEWKERTGLGFGLYGTPAESLCYRFAKIDRARFGDIEDVTDKGYYINSFHVDIREDIDAFSKLKFESEFQKLSKGGCISYVEIPNMMKNLTALKQLVNFIYHNIQYAEFNTKSDACHVCNYEGEIEITNDLEWVCPCCGNNDKSQMNVVRRTCGYLGENYWNEGKTKEIKSRVLHL